MEKYQNEAEKAKIQEYAKEGIKRFLKYEYSYTELMEQAARAQLQIMEIINLVDQDDMHKVIIEDIHEFFYYAIRVFTLLKPLANEATEHENH